ncbi:MAG TPA: 50S ribosomal protein L10 [Patescibacteria group bacterium]|nr:50S ribosomal protein L10 [Patescibacteria group bacterium]
MLKQDKSTLINELSKDFKDASSISLVDFTGMNIVAQQDLKKKLKEAKARMIVAKNTLIKLAAKDAKLPEDIITDEILSGQTAVVFGKEDAVSPIQAIGNFAKDNEALKFKAGILDGAFQDKAGMEAISKLPGKEALKGQVVGNIASPMYMLISNLQASVQELIGTLTAKVG